MYKFDLYLEGAVNKPAGIVKDGRVVLQKTIDILCDEALGFKEVNSLSKNHRVLIFSGYEGYEQRIDYFTFRNIGERTPLSEEGFRVMAAMRLYPKSLLRGIVPEYGPEGLNEIWYLANSISFYLTSREIGHYIEIGGIPVTGTHVREGFTLKDFNELFSSDSVPKPGAVEARGSPTRIS